MGERKQVGGKDLCDPLKKGEGGEAATVVCYRAEEIGSKGTGFGGSEGESISLPSSLSRVYCLYLKKIEVIVKLILKIK